MGVHTSSANSGPSTAAFVAGICDDLVEYLHGRDATVETMSLIEAAAAASEAGAGAEAAGSGAADVTYWDPATFQGMSNMYAYSCPATKHSSKPPTSDKPNIMSPADAHMLSPQAGDGPSGEFCFDSGASSSTFTTTSSVAADVGDTSTAAAGAHLSHHQPTDEGCQKVQRTAAVPQPSAVVHTLHRVLAVMLGLLLRGFPSASQEAEFAAFNNRRLYLNDALALGLMVLVACGQMASGQMACEQMASGQMACGQMASGQIDCGQMAKELPSTQGFTR